MDDLPSADKAYKARFVLSVHDIWRSTDKDSLDSFPRRLAPRLLKLYCSSAWLQFQAVWPSGLWCHLIFSVSSIWVETPWLSVCCVCAREAGTSPPSAVCPRSISCPLFQTHLSNSSSSVRNVPLYPVKQTETPCCGPKYGTWRLCPARQNTHLELSTSACLAFKELSSEDLETKVFLCMHLSWNGKPHGQGLMHFY